MIQAEPTSVIDRTEHCTLGNALSPQHASFSELLRLPGSLLSRCMPTGDVEFRSPTVVMLIVARVTRLERDEPLSIQLKGLDLFGSRSAKLWKAASRTY